MRINHRGRREFTQRTQRDHVFSEAKTRVDDGDK